MRTVSFSGKNVRSSLNNEFVNTFTNTTGDPTAGQSIWHSPDDLPGQCARGVGGQNVQTIFMTPEGRIFHAATGYLSPDDLLGEIKFAKELFGRIESSPGDARSIVSKAHRERLESLGFSKKEIESAHSGNPFAATLITQKVEPGNIFAGKTRKEILMGNAFSVKHPMMDHREFEKDPTVLVGKGKSAFVSTRSDGVTPKKRRESLEDERNSK